MGSDSCSSLSASLAPYFNPRSPHGERHPPSAPNLLVTEISIHAPRMGSDCRDTVRHCCTKFQSTLPAWGATELPLRESAADKISIHAPRMGSDLVMLNDPAMGIEFQSTLPAWGATCPKLRQYNRPSISIHAPRMGSDGGCDVYVSDNNTNISIHAPRMGSDRRRKV